MAIELSASAPTSVVVGGSSSGTSNRRTSRIEDASQIQAVPEEEVEEINGNTEDDDDDEYMDPKSRYFSTVNIICIVVSLLISAFLIFESQIVSTFWKIASPEETPEYLINLKSCKVPNLYDGQSELPFMWSVDESHLSEYDMDLKCERVEKFSGVLDDNKIVLLSKLKKRSCCLRDITRSKKMVADLYLVSETCPEIKNMSDISGKEFILIQCTHNKNKSVNFNTHALIPIKPSVQEKLDYWISHYNTKGNSFENDADRPFSVAVIVVGSTSRAHAYRSLPETMSFLEGKSGFTVMNGYNIIEDWRTTLSHANMIQLLTGSLGPEENDFIPYWDNETKLFSDFENEKFVTMLVDESRKLLKSSHGDPYLLNRFRAFLKQPTDYYLKPFLEGHKEATEALFPKQATSKYHCFGKRTSTSYLLRHLSKFHRKFSSVPSFSFSYFGWPQSQHGMEALSKMDKTYLEFFKEFLKTPQVLERTAIVLMSDIGSMNHPYFKTEHGLLEKLNPLMMIRLPDKLVRSNPALKENLKANSHRLISPLDVHRSISIFSKIGVPKRKTNALATNNVPSDEEKEQKKVFGKNIFVSEIPPDRNCSEAFIPDHLCPCGVPLPSKFNGMTIISKDGQPEKYWRYHMLTQ